MKVKNTSADRKIVIGSLFADANFAHPSLEMDELMFFNRPLTEAEIIMMNPWPAWFGQNWFWKMTGILCLTEHWMFHLS